MSPTCLLLIAAAERNAGNAQFIYGGFGLVDFKGSSSNVNRLCQDIREVGRAYPLFFHTIHKERNLSSLPTRRDVMPVAGLPVGHIGGYTIFYLSIPGDKAQIVGPIFHEAQAVGPFVADLKKDVILLVIAIPIGAQPELNAALFQAQVIGRGQGSAYRFH
jgi:hypothetical protein